ncbi:AMP-binding protein [Comamonas sp.]|uniref:AMP-binding protein n=1 Tax=Comamonas sp. TaxID=34028 RepID=UPI00289B5431|nr:AMP-binding protein [Comamonas sp.]
MSGSQALTAPLAGWQRLVHGPLAHWAQQRPDAIAIDDGQQRMGFADLHAAVQQHAQALEAQNAPHTRLLDASQPPAALITDFLATNASGRCAALGDRAWSPAQQAQAQQWIDALAAAPRSDGHRDAALQPFYIGFTSGSTGLPKGFRRHHQSWSESFRVCVDSFGQAANGCVMAPGSLSHSLFLFGALQGIWTGGGTQLQPRFSASQCLATLRQQATPCLVAVPSQLLVMLQLAERRALAPITSLALLMISGARWMRQHTPALQALFPNARIVEFYGASEASFIAWMDAHAYTAPQVVGRPFSNVQLQIRDARLQPLPHGEVGTIWLRSPMLFIDYVGAQADATAALRDGEWLSVRDMGSLDAQGILTLVGREKRMIVTQGKNLFPEEVEAVLCEHPRVAAASVHGVDDALRGKQVWVALQLRDGADAAPAALLTAGLQPLADAALARELAEWCRSRLEAHKCPRRWFSAAPWPQTASGKTDHPSLAQWLAAALPSADKTA